MIAQAVTRSVRDELYYNGSGKYNSKIWDSL